MFKAYIINTNKKNDVSCELEMIKDKKCAAYYSPWKENIDKIKLNDLIFLYSNKYGIIAKGFALGIPKLKEYKGKLGEEHYMKLDRFEKLSTPLKVSQISQILNRSIVLNQTQTTLDYDDGLKIWNYITERCL